MAAIADRAHGVVTRAGLLGAGVSSTGIERRVRKGLLIPRYPGVYRVGHAAPSVDASFMAAVKACGEGAVLSGRAAAHLVGLLKGAAPKPEVTAPTERRVKGIETHRARRNRATTKVRGIHVTSVPETLVDLAAVLTPEELARACHEAGVKYGTTPRQVEAVLKRRPNAPDARKLRAVMRGDIPVTLSKLERVFFEALREAKLPLPGTNKRVDGRRVDCRWPGLTVELDSYRFHNSRHSWEMDRKREREARARRDVFRRYTWFDVTDGRRQMLGDLSALL
jgi:putative AbiEi antitoxin of type IV toxin-antitoxin system